MTTIGNLIQSMLRPRWYRQQQLQRAARQNDAILKKLKPGVPAVVYFTLPNCKPCETLQEPAWPGIGRQQRGRRRSTAHAAVRRIVASHTHSI